ncbi:putative classical arabinogalactan protein 9 [Iris pallida]|uniref:Classical arabinogalactan protein 9 n=1 Tax=Iris pallida TaxID=29817 RepID=A0AAX6FXG9_IRIPA|nr:putative classical arabinogalactan protein 9 [Iris pallida]
MLPAVGITGDLTAGLDLVPVPASSGPPRAALASTAASSAVDILANRNSLNLMELSVSPAKDLRQVSYGFT